MSKQDWIWVAIRIFGIYLLVMAITAVPAFVSSFIVLCHTWGSEGWLSMVAGEGEAARTLARMVEGIAVTSFANCANYFLQVVLLGGIGLYFIRSGKLIFRWVFPPDAPTGDDPA